MLLLPAESLRALSSAAAGSSAAEMGEEGGGRSATDIELKDGQGSTEQQQYMSSRVEQRKAVAESRAQAAWSCG